MIHDITFYQNITDSEIIKCVKSHIIRNKCAYKVSECSQLILQTALYLQSLCEKATQYYH